MNGNFILNLSVQNDYNSRCHEIAFVLEGEGHKRKKRIEEDRK